MLRQAFRQGIEAAEIGRVQNPYVPGSHLHQAWMAGWIALAGADQEADERWHD